MALGEEPLNLAESCFASVLARRAFSSLGTSEPEEASRGRSGGARLDATSLRRPGDAGGKRRSWPGATASSYNRMEEARMSAEKFMFLISRGVCRDDKDFFL